MEIKILGTGCPKCKALEKNVRDAVNEAGIEAEIDKVTDITKIMDYDILMTPGLAVNGNVVLSGRLASKEEIKNLLKKAAK